MRLFIYLSLPLFLLSCETKPGNSDDHSAPDNTALNEALLGTWEIVEMRLKAPTFSGSDTTFTQHITEAEWGQVYGVKPARTVFTDDGKFKRTLYMRSGQVADVVNGLWKVEGDSLLTIEPNVTLSYLTTLNGASLKLKGKIDYDRDGAADDDYEANYRLVARTN